LVKKSITRHKDGSTIKTKESHSKQRKTVLITGGTGFLGKRLALDLKTKYHVVLGGRDNKRNMTAFHFTGCEVIPMDVGCIESVRDAVVSTRPDVIIHAAATKFVDLAEKQPMECIDVNVVGSQNVARVAVDKNVEMVIGISTDKASPPVRNTYGLSKALMERLFCSMNGKTGTRFVCVRYGNVAWSTGSVLPIWKRMHEQTGIIGTTGPEMRRFFFTVDEAVRLVVTAMKNVRELQGKVLSRKMKSAQIEDVLRVWIGSKGGRWEKIEGRPGERDDEFLIGDLELPYTSEVMYGGIPHYVISFNQKAVLPLKVGLSSSNAERLSDEEILAIIDNPPIDEMGEA
jgi:FlaA1/EpsC-like NDP-sugar epimerase